MKKFISVFMSVAMLLTITTGLTFTANADTLKSGDFSYEVLADGNVKITKYEGKDAKVEIPTAIEGKAVTELGDYAFGDCRELDEVTVPKTVNKIGNGVFYIILPNDDLKHVDVYYGGNKIDWVRMANNTDLYACTIHYAEKTAVDDFAFDITEENEIDIFRYEGTDSVVTIPEYANGLKVAKISRLMSSKIKKVIIGESISQIEEFLAFRECYNLESIEVSKDNAKYASSNGVLFNKKKTKLIAYPQNKKIKSYKIPEAVTSIGRFAFAKCNYTSSVTISKNVKNINSSAFNCCTAIKSIKVSDSNKYFSSKDGVLFNKKQTKLIAYPSGKTGKTYTVPKTVKTIGVAFSGCKNLKNIKIPKSVKLIVREDEFRNFGECNIKKVYYGGSKSDWSKIKKQYTTMGKTVTKKYGKTELKNIINGAKIYYNAKV